jgi:hypothetical protein
MRGTFKLLSFMLIMFILMIVSAHFLADKWTLWKQASSGKAGYASLVACNERLSTDPKYGNRIDHICELRSDFGVVERITLEPAMFERFRGKPIRVSLVANNKLIVTEPRIFAQELSWSILLFGFSFCFFVAILTLPKYKEMLSTGEANSLLFKTIFLKPEAPKPDSSQNRKALIPVLISVFFFSTLYVLSLRGSPRSWEGSRMSRSAA